MLRTSRRPRSGMMSKGMQGKGIGEPVPAAFHRSGLDQNGAHPNPTCQRGRAAFSSLTRRVTMVRC